MSYFPEPYSHSKRKVELDFSNYSAKSVLKGKVGINTSGFAKRTNLANLKSDVNKLDIDKLKIDPIDYSNLSNLVKNKVVKNVVHDELVKKVKVID